MAVSCSGYTREEGWDVDAVVLDDSTLGDPIRPCSFFSCKFGWWHTRESAKDPQAYTGSSCHPFTATMTALRPGAALTIPDLFRALDANIVEQVSLARSARRGQNPFSHLVVS